MPTRQEVFAALNSERLYQNQVWGGALSSDRAPEGDQKGGERTLDEFSLYIVRYANVLLEVAGTTANAQEKLEVIRKIGGLCVHAMEQHGAPHRNRRPAE